MPELITLKWKYETAYKMKGLLIKYIFLQNSEKFEICRKYARNIFFNFIIINFHYILVSIKYYYFFHFIIHLTKMNLFKIFISYGICLLNRNFLSTGKS